MTAGENAEAPRGCDQCHDLRAPSAPMLRGEAWQRLADPSELLCAKCAFDRAKERGISLSFADLLPCPFNILFGSPQRWFQLFLNAETQTPANTEEWNDVWRTIAGWCRSAEDETEPAP